MNYSKTNKKQFSKKFLLMGTQIEITIVSNDSEIDVNNVLESSANIFHSIVSRFTRFSESSELGILNSSNCEYVDVSDELFYLVEFGLNLTKQTDGMFDITIIDLLEAYGYDKNYTFDKLDNPNLTKEINELISIRPKYTEILLDAEKKRIKLARNQRIDMGAYTKGYAIKKVADLIKNAGYDNFIINAGGDIYANGVNKDGNHWKIALVDPHLVHNDKNSKPKTIELDNESIACSGGWARKIKQFNHLINPTTGSPIELKNSVFVKAKDPMIADGMATICYVCTEEVIKKMGKLFIFSR